MLPRLGFLCTFSASLLTPLALPSLYWMPELVCTLFCPLCFHGSPKSFSQLYTPVAALLEVLFEVTNPGCLEPNSVCSPPGSQLWKGPTCVLTGPVEPGWHLVPTSTPPGLLMGSGLSSAAATSLGLTLTFAPTPQPLNYSS